MTSFDDRCLRSDAFAESALLGMLEPLSELEGDVRAWLDLELASLVEGHFGEMIEAGQLSPADRAAWEAKATYRGEGLRSPNAAYMIAFWILENGTRVGTIAFGKTFIGGPLVSVHSLYVRPASRRKGLARGVLRGAFDAVQSHGSTGLYIATSWTWPDAVRFYVALGLWVRGWKHSLVFTCQRDLPEYRVEVSGGLARFLVLISGTWQVWFAAEPNGDELVWRDYRPERLAERFDESVFLAEGTFAIHLALRGWPLVRSRERWDARWRHSDCGEIEGLAGKIEVFEAVSRRQGHAIRTPRIPGIAYRDMDAIQAE